MAARGAVSKRNHFDVLEDGRLVHAPYARGNEEACAYVFEQAGGDERYIQALKDDDEAFLDFAKEYRVKRLPRQVAVTHGPSDEMLAALKALREERENSILEKGDMRAITEG
jgi:hypothetical protein